MNNQMNAADRVAALRDEYKRLGENVDHLSDLDLLNEYVERRDRERIDINDRYMRLLVEQRKYGEQVRQGTMAGLRARVDILATDAVRRMANDMTRILGAVEVLPERAPAERVELLKKIAADTRHMLRIDDQRPAKVWRLDDNRDLVRAARSVIGVLRDRDGIPAEEIIRLVSEALTPNGNLHDLFTVADQGTLKPQRQPQQPAFAGDDWTDTGGYYAYEPDGSVFRVVAYALGDTWYLDLQGPTGALIAAGETAELKVAALTAALIEQAPALAKSGRRPWQCWRSVTNRIEDVPAELAA